MVSVRKPPTSCADVWESEVRSVFLAGSIEMGTAEPWQDRLAQLLADVEVVLLNPRREVWDASWPQRADFAPFREQVTWELEGLERADRVVMYFDPATKAPITLLELGLVARSGRLCVCCPQGYWRRGNVEVVCARYGVPCVDSLEALAAHVRDGCSS